MQDAKQNLAEIYTDLYDLKYDFRNSNLIDLLVPLIKGDNVLEIGCGNGVLLKRLKDAGKSVTGIEPNEELIKIAKDINLDLDIVCGFAEDLDKLNAKKFDTIIMTDVLEHIENDGLLLENLRRHLNEAGELLLVVPAYQFLYGIRDKNIGHYRRYSKTALQKLLEDKNYKIEKIFYWNMLGVLPYFLYEKIWRKPMHTELRSGKKMNVGKKIIINFLFGWFKYIENKINFGFGLSVVCGAKLKK